MAIKLQEDAGIDIVCDGEMSRQHFVHGFLEFVDGIDFAHKVEMGIRADRYKAMVPQVRGELKLKGRVHGLETRHARAHTKKQLKITLPGPMTISDTIADRHYGDNVKMAMAFAGLLNEEARALEADGVDVIQFDEPAFNVFMDEVTTWGIEALHRAIDGLTCKTAVHICYGYGIKANIDWKNALGGEWTQYEKIFPALAKSRIDQVSLECINSRVPMKLLSLLAGKDVLVGVIDVATDEIETPETGGAGDRRGDEIRAEGAHRRLHQLRHGADAARHRRRQADGAGRGRRTGTPEIRLISINLRRFRARLVCCANGHKELRMFSNNVGVFDRIARVVVGLALILLCAWPDRARHRLELGRLDRRGADPDRRSSAPARPTAVRLFDALAPGAAHHVHQLGHLAPLVGFVAARDRMRDAMRHMVAQDFLLDAAQRRAHRGDLRDDVDAIAVVLDHAGEPAHLALDAVEPFAASTPCCLRFMRAIYPLGV